MTIQPPTGYASNVLSDVSVLTGGAGGARIADVLLTDSYTSFSAAQRAAITAFLGQQAGGLVLGGQAWSTGGNITNYAGNVLLAPFSVIQWTGQYGDTSSIAVAAAAPDPTTFNTDMCARAMLGHMSGAAPLAADTLAKGEGGAAAACRFAAPRRPGYAVCALCLTSCAARALARSRRHADLGDSADVLHLGDAGVLSVCGAVGVVWQPARRGAHQPGRRLDVRLRGRLGGGQQAGGASCAAS